jgi:hypothetical protein
MLTGNSAGIGTRLRIFGCVVTGILTATTIVHADTYPFDSELWEVEAAESSITKLYGRTALMLKGGSARLKDLQLTNGLIEFDIAASPERGFAGLIFRGQDNRNFEHFYIRPHQSGNPDANQYTPVFNGVSAWQLYHGAGFGAPVEYRSDGWMHIKIAFRDSRAEAYIDSKTPNVVIGDLKRPVAAGSVGVNVANFSPAYFANFVASPLPDDYVFAQVVDDKKVQAEEGVTSWLVSDVFASDSVDGVHRLDERHKDNRRWTTLRSEKGGVTNLARVQGLEEGKNTVFARLRISSDRRQKKGLSFGYSDAVAVFVNDELVYEGTNRYESRDYRYLGTIGLFDKIYLPLREGDNEVWFAVSEAFGGWGIQAEFDDSDGIRLRQE